MNDKLKLSIAAVKKSTHAKSPWTVADFSSDPDNAPEIDGHIAEILNAVASGALVPAQTWQRIDAAPDLERVIVAGWQPRIGSVAGYWWHHEDCTDEDGSPMEHPDATLFVRIADVIPAFPPAPEAGQ